MDLNKNSLLFVVLLNICGLCLCTQNPNKNKRFNCNKERIQNCTLTNDVLHCSDSNFSIEIILPNDPISVDESSELQTRHDKCYVPWKRIKAKIHRCAMILDNDIQKHNYKCNCHCIVSREILDVNRRDVSETSSEDKQFNISFHVAPAPEARLVVVEMFVENKIALVLQIYGLKLTKSGRCNGKRIHETSYNLSSPDMQNIRFSFNVSKPGNYCLFVSVNFDHDYKNYFRYFEMEPPKDSSMLKASSTTESLTFYKDFAFYIIIIFIVLFVVVFGIGFHIYRRRKNQTLPSKEVQAKNNEIVAESRQKVLIIYGSRKETVKLFASVLENLSLNLNLNCTIVGDWILKEEREIAESMVHWVTKNVEDCDKIIVVNCKTTLDRQEQFLQHPNANTSDVENRDDYMYSIFDHFLTIAHSKYLQYKNKIFNIRFHGTSNDCTLKYIGTDTGSLEIPLQFEDLFIWIHNMNPKDVAENLDLGLTKESSFKEFSCHLNVGNSSEEAEGSTSSEPQSPSSTTTLINASFQFANER